jgi:hypothetical protein
MHTQNSVGTDQQLDSSPGAEGHMQFEPSTAAIREKCPGAIDGARSRQTPVSGAGLLDERRCIRQLALPRIEEPLASALLGASLRPRRAGDTEVLELAVHEQLGGCEMPERLARALLGVATAGTRLCSVVHGGSLIRDVPTGKPQLA